MPIQVLHVQKLLTDSETEALKGKFLDVQHAPTVLTDDADVYGPDGRLLLKFRKKVFTPTEINNMYNAIKDFAKNTTTNRGIATASVPGTKTGQKVPVASNIMGYFDSWSVSQRAKFKREGIQPPAPCRECRFNKSYPEQWAKCIPMIQTIDRLYSELCPEYHAHQLESANLTPYRIANTAFSTITTNLNFRTAAHTDSGDWPSGFGNLTVITDGESYTGGYTCFPQYGIAVDCRMGDFVAMDVHQVHGNIPRDNTNGNRLSIVCYLREGIIKKSAHLTNGTP
jgi:hypothetical protein